MCIEAESSLSFVCTIFYRKATDKCISIVQAFSLMSKA